MAYDPGAIDSALVAAVGDEPALIAELRLAFADGITRAFDALRKATDGDEWRTAAWRMKGLAASFGAVRLMTLATQAADGPPRDAEIIRKLARAIAGL